MEATIAPFYEMTLKYPSFSWTTNYGRSNSSNNVKFMQFFILNQSFNVNNAVFCCWGIQTPYTRLVQICAPLCEYIKWDQYLVLAYYICHTQQQLQGEFFFYWLLKSKKSYYTLHLYFCRLFYGDRHLCCDMQALNIKTSCCYKKYYISPVTLCLQLSLCFN